MPDNGTGRVTDGNYFVDLHSFGRDCHTDENTLMVKNWFAFVIGIQYLFACVYDIAQGRYIMATIWFAYGIASVALAVV